MVSENEFVILYDKYRWVWKKKNCGFFKIHFFIKMKNKFKQ
jgi:hypothetical protein